MITPYIHKFKPPICLIGLSQLAWYNAEKPSSAPRKTQEPGWIERDIVALHLTRQMAVLAGIDRASN
jgi:hypothetical protein